MNTSSTYSREVTFFFLILAGVFGVTVRVFPILRSGFPLVDGGMFYVMIKDLQAAHFSLPLFTTYNQGGIPFAYPPLAFYFAGWLNHVSNISILNILRWLPVIVTIAIIPVFFLFSSQLLGSQPRAALATLIFSLTPNSYWWNIVGGGLTRAPGTLFFTVTMLSVYQMFRSRTRPWILAAILSATGSVFSHPAWALQSVVGSALLWWYYGRDKQGAGFSAIVALGVLALTSPWWLSVVQRHGIETLVNAGNVTNSRWLFWTVFFALSFTGEYVPVIAVFGLIGFFMHLAKKDYFLIAWVLCCLLVDPRGGLPAAIFPFSLMAATVFADGIAPHLADENPATSAGDRWMDALKSGQGRLFFGFFILLFVYGAYKVSNTLSRQALGVAEFKAISWVTENTQPGDHFLILDEQGNPLLSPLTEWFPALAERRSIATLQGSEWLRENSYYNNQYELILGIHDCLYQDVGCLRKYQMGLPNGYEYILLSVETRNGGVAALPLAISLTQDPGFTPVYTSPTIEIFRLKASD